MSFFASIFKDDGKKKSFLWITNQLDEIVVVGVENPVVDLSQPFHVARSWKRMVNEMMQDSDLITPYVFSGNYLDTWDSILAVLNGKPCARRTEYRAIWYALNRLGSESPIGKKYVNGKSVYIMKVDKINLIAPWLENLEK